MSNLVTIQLNNSVIMQVAERSLFLWNNEYIVTLVAQHRQVILPVVFNALESNARSHWNPAVHGLTSNVKKVFQDMDLNLWRECEAHYQQEEVCKRVLLLALPSCTYMCCRQGMQQALCVGFSRHAVSI